VLREPALHVRETPRAAEEQHVRAQIRAPGAAVVAGEARARGIERGFTAGFDAADAGADLDDDAGDLVPERQRFADKKIADRAAVVVVQVRAADAAVGHRDADLVGRERRVGARLDPDVLRPVTHRREHANTQSCARMCTLTSFLSECSQRTLSAWPGERP